MVTAGWGGLAVFPCHHPHLCFHLQNLLLLYRTLTLVLLWIPFSTAATQTANKIHCIFAPLSSSVFWHIQMPGLKRVNKENNVFLSRHSKKGLTEASEDAAGRDTPPTAVCVLWQPFLDQPHGFIGLQIFRQLVWHVVSILKEGFSFVFMITLSFMLKDSLDVLKFMNL